MNNDSMKIPAAILALLMVGALIFATGIYIGSSGENNQEDKQTSNPEKMDSPEKEEEEIQEELQNVSENLNQLSQDLE